MGEVVKFIPKVEVEKRALALALDCLCVTFAIGEGKSINKQKKLADYCRDVYKRTFETDCPEHKKFGVCFEEIAQGLLIELQKDKSFMDGFWETHKSRIEEIKTQYSNNCAEGKKQ